MAIDPSQMQSGGGAQGGPSGPSAGGGPPSGAPGGGINPAALAALAKLQRRTHKGRSKGKHKSKRRK